MSMRKYAGIACSMALVATLATGCMPTTAQTSAASSSAAVTPARAYITSVHEIYANISTQTDALKKAAEATDASAVHAALDKIDQQVSDLQGIDAPSGLEDLQANYLDATKCLAEALRDYAEYRLEGGAQDADAATQLAAIQASYAQGIGKLKAADEIAKGL